MRKTCLSLLLLLAACGTTAPNADVNQGLTGISGRTAVVEDNAAVAVVDTGPTVEEGGLRVSGTSCKNKMWDPAATDANAMALMKRQAAEKGFNAVHSVKVDKVDAAVALNCWSAITATGIAFKQG